jgi:hypothetical protein
LCQPRKHKRLAAQRLGEPLVTHDERDHETPLGGQEARKDAERAAGRIELAREVEQRARRVVGGDEADPRGPVVAVDHHAGHPPSLVHDARGALAEPRLPAVGVEPLDQEVGDLLLASREAQDAARPRAVEPRDGEIGQVDRVAREPRRHVDDRAVLVIARELGEERRRALAVEPREGCRDALGLAPLPEGAGRPDQVSFEGRVSGRIRPRELGVELVDDAPHFGVHAVDLLAEELHLGRHFEAQARREHLEHGIERGRAPPERLRLRELDEHAAPGWRRPGKERERTARERDAVELIRRRAPPLSQHEHSPRPPGEQRRGRQRAEAGPEDRDVIMLRHEVAST